MCVVCLPLLCVQDGGARERVERERLTRAGGAGVLPIGGGGQSVRRLSSQSGKQGSVRDVRGELLEHWWFLLFRLL